jgi:hypothetical protein
LHYILEVLGTSSPAKPLQDIVLKEIVDDC